MNDHQEQLDTVAFEKSVRNEVALDAHLKACAQAHIETNKSINGLYKLIRNIGGSIIVGLLAVVGFLIAELWDKT